MNKTIKALFVVSVVLMVLPGISFAQNAPVAGIRHLLTCSDSDATSAFPTGKNYGVFGTVTYGFGNQAFHSSDFCVGKNRLMEFYCPSPNSWPSSTITTCSYGCSNGACNPAPVNNSVPVITIKGDAKITITVGTTYTDPGATATDSVDGDITSKIVVVNPVDTSKVGTYIITYNVTDSAGNKAVQVTREVDVVAQTDKTAPQVSITNPSSGATLSQTVSVITIASDPAVVGQISSGVKQVQFYVDSTAFGNPVTSPPYQISLDTTKFSDGQHVLGAVATDNQGNFSTMATVSVNFSNAPVINPNLISNPSLENGTTTPTDWFSSAWGTNDATFVYPVTGHTGKGASVTINNYTSGDAKWYFKNIPVIPGKYYLFGDWYESSVGTHVVIEFQNTDSTLSYQEIGTPNASASWQNFQAGFNAPLNSTSLTIYHLLNTAGTLTVDDFSLIQTINPNAFSRGIVSLTFDDGWQTNYDTAVPMLNTAGLKSTQYIITGSIGDTADGYMTLPELQSIYQQGHEIAAHTRTHVDLTAPNVDLQSEIAGSRNDLLPYFSPVDSIAYPYGLYNPTVQAAVTAAGFLGARTVDHGFNDKATNPLTLTVQIVERGGVCDTDNAPVTTLDQVKNWIDTAAATNTWLILVFHQTDTDTTNCYGDTPTMLQNIIDYLKTSNVNVETVTQGLHQLNGVH